MAKIPHLFEVRQHPSIRKKLGAIPSRFRTRIQEKIKSLAQMPRPKSCEKVRADDAYRVRVGDYRIIYQVDDKTRTVMVKAIGHRSQIYRKRT